MGVYKYKDTYGIDYYDQNGERVRQIIGPSKKLAEDVFSKRKVELAENKHLDIKRNKKITFEEFIEKFTELYAKSKKSWKSGFSNCLKRLNEFFADKYLYQINSQMIEQYRNKRVSEGLMNATVNRELACLSSVFNKAIQWGDAFENPMKRIKLAKENNQRVRYLSKLEYARLLEHCDEQLRTLVMLALNTGLRKGEIQKISFNDVNFETNTLTISEQKNGRKDWIPLNQTASDLLLEVKKSSKVDYPFSYNFRKAFETAIKRAKISDFRFHDLRHTFASWLVMAGVDIYTVMSLMRHQDIKMTQRYAHLSPDHKARGVEKLVRFWSDDHKSVETDNLIDAVKPND